MPATSPSFREALPHGEESGSRVPRDQERAEHQDGLAVLLDRLVAGDGQDDDADHDKEATAKADDSGIPLDEHHPGRRSVLFTEQDVAERTILERLRKLGDRPSGRRLGPRAATGRLAGRPPNGVAPAAGRDRPHHQVDGDLGEQYFNDWSELMPSDRRELLVPTQAA
jgi:hypothetical protein